MAKTLEDYVDDVIEKGTIEEHKQMLRNQSFLLSAGKDINAASNNIYDIVATAANLLGEHFNAASSVGLSYDETTHNFLYHDHHGVVPEEFLSQVRDLIKESYLWGTVMCGPLGKNYELELITVPIINQEYAKEGPDYVQEGKYGAIQLAREKNSFDEGLDRLIIEEFARDIMLAVNDNHALGFDAVTKGKNIKKFFEEIDYEKKLASNKDYTFSVIMFDLDHFKNVNDKYESHEQGDNVLMEFAELMRSNIRMADTFARMGGEEFAILLPGMDFNKARAVAESLRKTVERYEFSELEGEGTLRITTSVGVAEYNKEKPNVRFQVDRQLYQAKNNGRNRVYPLNSEGLNKK